MVSIAQGEVLQGRWRHDEASSFSPSTSFCCPSESAKSDGTSITEDSEFANVASINTEGTADRDLLEPIAIVGYAIKLPGEADTPESYWQMLVEKRSAARQFPRDRINIDAFHGTDPERTNQISTRNAHFLDEDYRAFDAQFFNISPVEAGALQPHQRLLLESTYHALENAGISLASIAGSDASVHVGCFTADLTTSPWRDTESIPKYTATGAAASLLSNRLSWFYDLHGPSMTIDTACSSSMIALDLACQGLRSGTSKVAIVASSNLISSPELNVVLSNMNFLSKDGNCYSFDHRANGYARGEGCVSLILKPVSQAITDGDSIRALIRSVGVNQDGYTSGGITQPSQDQQAQLIRDTYRKAGLDMSLTAFFESHGTGTAIGDPIEARAMGECFRSFRSSTEPLYVGAVKSNIGHLEGASGLAGLVKAIMVLEKGIIPPNCNFEKLNPAIDAKFSHLDFPTRCVPWPGAGLRRASINSFGFGGANAHVVLDDAYHYLRTRGISTASAVSTIQSTAKLISEELKPVGDTTMATTSNPRSSLPQLLTLSASNQNSLRKLADALLRYLKNLPRPIDPSVLAAMAHTLNTRRTLLNYRLYAVISPETSSSNLENAFTDLMLAKKNAQNLGFIFTGQGAQWYAMGRELHACPVFKDSLLRTSKCLLDLGCSWSLLDELAASKDTTRINEPDRSQPICAAVQIALVDLLESVGITPSVVVGHSSGEIAAAYTAGYLSHFSAVKTAYFRGVLARKMRISASKPHTMASIGISKEEFLARAIQIELETRNLISASQITVSCINSPSNITVSGPLDMIEELVEHLHQKKVFARKLNVGVGYHSPQMLEIAPEYAECLGKLEARSIRKEVQMVSSVSSKIITAEETCESTYWVQNMVSPVDFSGAMKAANTRNTKDAPVKKLDGSHRKEIVMHGWMEVGPHAALQGCVRDILKHLNRTKEVLYTSALVRNRPALETMMEAIGILHCHNFQVDMRKLGSLHSITPVRLLSDLPQYPFDHSIIYWDESPKNKGYRLRQHSSNPLLGTPVLDWNPLDAKWNFVIRGSELPWIQDHRINGALLYPAAGMLVMAVEAVRSVAGSLNLSGYEIQNAYFHTPLMVSMTESVETQVTLRQTKTGTSRSTAQYEFRLYARRSDDEWDEISSCEIRADVATSNPANSEESVISADQMQSIQRHRTTELTCIQNVDEVELYKTLKSEIGMEYGPSFQALKEIRVNSNHEARATIIPYTWLREDYAVSQQAGEQVLHPTTLDSLFQAAIVTFGKDSNISSRTMVPIRLDRMWIASGGIGNSLNRVDQVVVRTKSVTPAGATSAFSVLSDQDGILRIQIDGLEARAVSVSENQTDDLGAPKHICHYMHYSIDLDTLDSAGILHYCETARSADAEPVIWYEELDLLTLSYTAHALEVLDKLNRQPEPEHLRYVAEMRRQLDLDLEKIPIEHHCDRQKSRVDSANLDALSKKLATSKSGRLNTKVGTNLSKILLGEVDPLEVIFSDPQLVADFYEETNTISSLFDLSGRYIDAMVHKNPNMKFLEIGAGTGATTAILLDTLEKLGNTPRYAQYDFTDISPSFLGRAKERFAKHDKLTYHVLDIEENPLDQGFNECDYDVIVAANVLHATKSLDKTMRHARSLLKPNGKLILVELTAESMKRAGFTFGLLPGWWASEDFRSDLDHGPCVSETEWNDVLKRTGFSGTDVVLRDFHDNICHTLSVMISTAVESNNATDMRMTNSSSPDLAMKSSVEYPVFSDQCSLSNGQKTPQAQTLLVFDENSELQTLLAREVYSRLESAHIPVGRVSLSSNDLNDRVQDNNCIVLWELDNTLLNKLGHDSFTCIQRLLTSAKCVVWATNGSGRSPITPDHGTVRGLMRVCQLENIQTKLVTVALEQVADCNRCASHLVKIYNLTLSQSLNSEFEPEYVEIDNQLQINRIMENHSLNEHIFQKTASPLSAQEFGSGMPLKLNVRVPGLLNTLEFVEDELFQAPLGTDEVEVEVHAVGLNIDDYLTVSGQTPSDVLGTECAGIVSRVGSGVSASMVGDRVYMLASNTFKRYARCSLNSVHKIPASMNFNEAAAVSVVFVTAYYAITEAARMRSTESILIYGPTSAVGQAAMQIAHWLGAEVYAVVSSPEEKRLLIEDQAFRRDRIFSDTNTSLMQNLQDSTNGRGVDVVFQATCSADEAPMWDCLAPFGRFVNLRCHESHNDLALQAQCKATNAMFTTVDPQGILENAGTLTNSIMRNITTLFEQSKLHPIHSTHVYALTELEDAFRELKNHEASHKLVVEVSAHAMVPVVAAPASNYQFDEQATYVIAGGLGGIGLSIAQWLVERGARNMILLSRSGLAKTQKAAEVVAKLSSTGAYIKCPSCDIADEGMLTRTIRDAIKDMPPIKGCFQAAMVLRDSTFAGMTYDNWKECTRPKIQGSWNLHKVLPSGMDFFILLSSACGVYGNPGQANYAAGDTYQDTLAEYRRSIGEKAISLDLGIVLGEGFVAENEQIMSHLLRVGALLPTSQAELLAMLDYYCNPSLGLPAPSQCQVIVGLELPANTLARGQELSPALTRPMFRYLHKIAGAADVKLKHDDNEYDHKVAFTNAATMNDAAEVVAEALKTKLSRTLGIPLDQIPSESRIDSLGVDSLVAVELRNWLTKEWEAEVAVFEILGGASPMSVGSMIAKKSSLSQKRWIVEA